MGKFIDLTGQRFGRLTVLYRAENRNKKTYWHCLCDCGNKNVVKSGAYLRSKNLKHEKSCGCVAEITKHLTKNNQFNKYDLSGKYGIGYMSNGKEFLFDIEDYNKIQNYCWHLDGNGYVVANSKDCTNSTIRLSRFVMNVDEPMILVDHKNWDLLDNRKSNLRIANRTENNINIHRKSNNTTGYTGITKQKSGNWLSRISKDGIRYNLGTYSTFEEAVIARHKAELLLHKEWSGEINRKDFQKILKQETLNE